MRLLKILAVFLSLVMIVNCLAAWNGAGIPLREVGPTTLVLLGLTHLALRAPYRPAPAWEWPFMALSICLASGGAFLFQPDGESQDPLFQPFFAAFVGLALLFGLVSTSSAPDTEWRRQVLEPTRNITGVSLPGIDLGLVFAPFVFPLLAARFYWRTRRD